MKEKKIINNRKNSDVNDQASVAKHVNNKINSHFIRFSKNIALISKENKRPKDKGKLVLTEDVKNGLLEKLDQEKIDLKDLNALKTIFFEEEDYVNEELFYEKKFGTKREIIAALINIRRNKLETEAKYLNMSNFSISIQNDNDWNENQAEKDEVVKIISAFKQKGDERDRKELDQIQDQHPSQLETKIKNYMINTQGVNKDPKIVKTFKRTRFKKKEDKDNGNSSNIKILNSRNLSQGVIPKNHNLKSVSQQDSNHNSQAESQNTNITNSINNNTDNVVNSNKDSVIPEIEMADNNKSNFNSTNRNSLDSRNNFKLINKELRQKSKEKNISKRNEFFDIQKQKASLFVDISNKLNDIQQKSIDTSTNLDINNVDKLPAFYKDSWNTLSNIQFHNVQAQIKNYIEHFQSIVDNGTKRDNKGFDIMQMTAIVMSLFYFCRDMHEIITKLFELFKVIDTEEKMKAKLGLKGNKWNNRGILSMDTKIQLFSQGKFVADEEWNKKSLGEKISLRFKFSDYNQNPNFKIWNKLSDDEKILFLQQKIQWRMQRIEAFTHNIEENSPQLGFYLNNFFYYNNRDRKGNLIIIPDHINNKVFDTFDSTAITEYTNQENDLSKDFKIGGFIYHRGKKILSKGLSFNNFIDNNNKKIFNAYAYKNNNFKKNYNAKDKAFNYAYAITSVNNQNNNVNKYSSFHYKHNVSNNLHSQNNNLQSQNNNLQSQNNNFSHNFNNTGHTNNYNNNTRTNSLHNASLINNSNLVNNNNLINNNNNLGDSIHRGSLINNSNLFNNNINYNDNFCSIDELQPLPLPSIIQQSKENNFSDKYNYSLILSKSNNKIDNNSAMFNSNTNDINNMNTNLRPIGRIPLLEASYIAKDMHDPSIANINNTTNNINNNNISNNNCIPVTFNKINKTQFINDNCSSKSSTPNNNISNLNNSCGQNF